MRMERSEWSRFEGEFGTDQRGFGNGLDAPSMGEVSGYFQFLLVL